MNSIKTLIKLIIATAFVIGIYYAVNGFSFTSKTNAPKLALPKVIVQKPQWNEVVDYVTQTGTLVTYNSVDLVARVEGFLEAIKFVDGSIVKKGQELLVIQPEPYLEKLKAAQANVQVQKANYAYAKSEYARQKKMFEQNATSQNNVEKWLAKTQEAKGQIDEAVANEAIAAINYSYTHIYAPFDGRIGRHLVDTGNLVGNGVATNLANIQQLDPIYAYFNLNELDLIRLRASAQSQGKTPNDIKELPVYVRLQNETTFTHRGQLDFANTALNASTGTLELRALLDNAEHTLLPGLFVQVRIPVSSAKQLTVASSAVLYDQIGAYVLTVDAKNLVHSKRVEVGNSDEGYQSILSGLTEQDRVIVSGLQFATPGNAVEVTELPQVSKSPDIKSNDSNTSTTNDI